MLTLGIDTSNYATSLAVFDTDAGEVVCDCKKFLPVKEGQLGLRQSDALFHHTAALPEMLAELSGKADLTKVAAVGVSAKPRPVEGSYMPCFLAGVSAATAFAPMLLRVGGQLLVVFTETTDSSSPHGMLMNMDGCFQSSNRI